MVEYDDTENPKLVAEAIKAFTEAGVTFIQPSESEQEKFTAAGIAIADEWSA